MELTYKANAVLEIIIVVLVPSRERPRQLNSWRFNSSGKLGITEEWAAISYHSIQEPDSRKAASTSSISEEVKATSNLEILLHHHTPESLIMH